MSHFGAYSPPFPCLTVVGRERGAGTSSTQIVSKGARFEMKPTIDPFFCQEMGRSFSKPSKRCEAFPTALT